MEENNKIRFEEPDKPEINDLIEITPNTEEFEEPEKAEALIKNLNLSVGDTLRENGDNYIINSRMVLQGDNPKHYKDTIENLKKILTKKEIKAISNYIKRKKEDKKIRDKIYYSIEKRTDKFYYRRNIKKSNPEEIKEVLEFFKADCSCGLNNTIYHLLSKEDKDFVRCYECAWFENLIPNIQKWREVNDGEYMVLTDSEADYQANEYLTDDPELWKMAVDSGNTTDSLEEWAEYVLRCDGRGSVLNSYDNCEESEEINDIWYYIYRTN